MIYKISESWPFEFSPSIESHGDRDEWWDDKRVVQAHIHKDHGEILEGLKKFHCIPVGESYPFVTEEFAEYLESYVGVNVLFRAAEIIHKDQILSGYRQFCVTSELDCVAIEESVFSEGTIVYAKFRENEPQGCWVSNMPYTYNIAQICSQEFERLIKGSIYSENSFRFLFGCCPFVSDMIEYFGKEVLRLLAERLNEPDYQKNPFLLRTRRPEIFKRIIQVGKMPGKYIDRAALENLSKDEYLALLLQKAMLMLEDEG